MSDIEKKAIKVYIYKKIQERPFESKSFYLRRLHISHHTFIDIIKEMINEKILIEKIGLESRKFINSRFRPRKNVKYLMLR